MPVSKNRKGHKEKSAKRAKARNEKRKLMKAQLMKFIESQNQQNNGVQTVTE